MGIVTWRGRDRVAVLSDLKGQPVSSDARGMSQRRGVVAARSVEIVAMEAQRCRPDVGPPWGMSRALLKLSGSLVHDYATISDDSPSPNRASRARRAATSAGIS